MTKHPLQNALESQGLDTRDYSGRGMHGEGCLAVVTGNVGELIASVVRGVAEDAAHAEDIAEAFEKMKTDSMGRLDTVVYFPGIKHSPDGE